MQSRYLSRRPFYGWWIVVGAVICQFVSMSIGQAVVGIFLNPVIDDLGWAVWQFTLGPSLAMGLGAFAGVFVGPVVDRRGPRGLIILGALVSAACFYGLGHQSNLVLFLILYLVSGLIGWNLFGPLVVNATLNKWFVGRRGWALAIGSIGISLGGLITPLAMIAVVDSMGWRNGYTVLALLVLIVIIPIAFIMRRTPEDYGLLPDGADPQAEDVDRPVFPVARGLTRRDALHTGAFWLLVLGFGLQLAALSSVLLHAIPFVTNAGFARSLAGVALTVNGFGNLLSKPVWGYSLQHVEARKLILVAFSLSALGVGMMLGAASTGLVALLLPGFFFYGFGFGGTIPLGEYIWAHYFGRAHIGAIRGIGQPLSLIGPTVGPILVGLAYDLEGSYQLSFRVIIVVFLIAAGLIWLSRAPAPDPEIDESATRPRQRSGSAR